LSSTSATAPTSGIMLNINLPKNLPAGTYAFAVDAIQNLGSARNVFQAGFNLVVQVSQ